MRGSTAATLRKRRTAPVSVERRRRSGGRRSGWWPGTGRWPASSWLHPGRAPSPATSVELPNCVQERSATRTQDVTTSLGGCPAVATRCSPPSSLGYAARGSWSTSRPSARASWPGTRRSTAACRPGPCRGSSGGSRSSPSSSRVRPGRSRRTSSRRGRRRIGAARPARSSTCTAAASSARSTSSRCATRCVSPRRRGRGWCCPTTRWPPSTPGATPTRPWSR